MAVFKDWLTEYLKIKQLALESWYEPEQVNSGTPLVMDEGSLTLLFDQRSKRTDSSLLPLFFPEHLILIKYDMTTRNGERICFLFWIHLIGYWTFPVAPTSHYFVSHYQLHIYFICLVIY